MFNRRKKKKEDKGFPCPACMQNFTSVEEIKAHYDVHHSDQNGQAIENQVEGFLCPVCKKSLASPEMLQFHYDAEHNEDAPVPDSSHPSNGEITGVEIQELRKKLELLQSQLQGSEESRTLLSTEVLHSEQKASQFSMQLESLKIEKEIFKSKADQLGAEIDILKAKVEEGKGQEYSLEEDIKALKQQLDDRVSYAKNLENQLAERPEADAIIVIKQELMATKSLMDRILQEKEKEKEELEKECKIYKVQCTIQETKVEELMTKLKEAPKLEDIFRLQLALRERESDVKDLTTSTERLEFDLAQLQDGKRKLLNQLDHLSKSASEGQTTISELQEQLIHSGQEKRNLHNILMTTQSDLLEAKADMLKTRNRLLQSSKLVKEQLSTISQLQTALDEKDQVTSQVEQESEKTKEAFEKMKAELDTVKFMLNTRTKELEDYQRLMSDCESSSQSVILQKDQEINDMKFKVEKLQGDLNAKSTEISDMQNELITSNKLIADERQVNDDLKVHLMEHTARFEEEVRKLTLIEAKMKDLGDKVLSLSEEKQRLENEKQDLVAKIEAGDGISELIHQMKQENSCLQEKLLLLEATLQDQIAEHFNKEEILHKHLLEVRGQLQESESKILKLVSGLEKKSVKVKAFQQKLLELESELKVKSELLLTSEATKNSQRVELESHLKTANISLEKTTAHLTSTKSQLDLADKDVTIKKEKIFQLESKLHDQKEELFQIKQKVNSLERELKEKSSRLVQVEAEKRELEDTIYANNQIIIDIKRKLTKVEQDLEVERKSKTAEISDFSKRLEKLAAENADLQQTFDDMNSRLVQAEIEQREMEDIISANNKIIADTRETLVKAEQSLEMEKSTKSIENAEFSKKLEKMATEKKDLQQIVCNMNANMAEMERKHTEKDRELENVLKDLSNTQNELKNIQETFQKTRENCDDQLIFLTTQFERDRRKADEAKEEFVKQVSSLTNEISGLKEDKMAVLNQIINLNQQLQQNISERDIIKGQLEMEKLILQAEMRNVQKNLEQANAKNDECRNNIADLNIVLQMEQESKQQKIAKLMADKDILFHEKIDSDSKLLELQLKAEEWAEERAKIKREAAEVEKVLQQENSALVKNLAAEISAMKRLQIEKDEFEKQSTLLGDNLTTLRSDLLNAESSCIELSTVNEHFQREIVDLQSRLDRNIDEKRLLIERCESSEKKCEKLMENLTEQNYKLEDIQGALQELGRENQTLQITTTRFEGRKWAGDSEATDCTSCGKIFSVTVRKHHCRNCGQIFCKECSNKTSQTPLINKSVRVCDSCYKELRVHRK